MAQERFVVCVDNNGLQASLELHKLYRVIADEAGTRLGQLRVIDESGEDYLYPGELFLAVDLDERVTRRLLMAA